MQWIEAVINAEQGKVEELCETLNNIGIEEFVIEDEKDFQNFLKENHKYWDYVDEELERHFKGISRIKFYLPVKNASYEELETISKSIGITPDISIVDDSEWERCWEKYYKPLEVGERIVIVPEWEKWDGTGRLILRLDPGLSFGTGEHATTKMCLRELERNVKPGMKILDLGCGSGILSIGAILLGCQDATACDIDIVAEKAARRNAELNSIPEEKFKIMIGDVISEKNLRKRLGSDYDIVVANIVTDVIVPLIPFVRGFMSDKSIFVCSGIIDGRENEVVEALNRSGFKIKNHSLEEEWHCFTAV